VSDREGWKPCEYSFHETLATRPADSDQTVRFLELRERFDRILAEAWRLRGDKGTDFERDILQEYNLRLGQYQKEYDLMYRRIWSEGDGKLRASLREVPGASIALYNGGNSHNVHIMLEYHYDGPLPYDSPEAGQTPQPQNLSELSLDECFDIIFPERQY